MFLFDSSKELIWRWILLYDYCEDNHIYLLVIGSDNHELLFINWIRIRSDKKVSQVMMISKIDINWYICISYVTLAFQNQFKIIVISNKIYVLSVYILYTSLLIQNIVIYWTYVFCFARGVLLWRASINPRFYLFARGEISKEF